MRAIRLSLIAGFLLLMLVPAVSAQDFRATLFGVVTDPTGAAIPGATVRAINVATNEVKEVKTTADGTYAIPYLNPGTYNVEATAPGFRTLKREGIVVRVADKLNLALELTIGAVTEEVTVVARQEVIETGSADRGLVYDPVKTQAYPLNGRQTYMLLSLTPGVLFTQETFGPYGYSGTRGWDVSSAYRINGARAGQNLFLLNGAPISDYGGTWQVAPNVEAVQEFKVMTNTYDAQWGRFGGGVVNTTLRSGTNEWHGDVFWYFRNKVFDANYFQNNLTGKPVPKHNQHQFGGVVGGPVRKDKDFVFASFEGWQERLGVPSTATVAPLPLREAQGFNFNALGYRIYDPMTTHICGTRPGDVCGPGEAGKVYIRDQFPGNVMPANRISPIGKKILSYYPAPSPGLENALVDNFVAAANVARYHYEQPMVRWDHIFSENDKVYGLWTYQHGHEWRDSVGFGPPAGSGDMNSGRSNQNYVFAWTHVLSPTAVLDIRASRGRYTQVFPRYSDFDLTADELGMTQMIHAPTWTKNTVPVINIGGYTHLFGFNPAGTLMSGYTYNQWNLTPSLTMTRGKHTLHFGFEFNYVARANFSYGWSNGNFTFGTMWTQRRPDRRADAFDGNGIATLLLGTPTSGYVDWNDDAYRTRPYYAGYVQDDWRLTPRLTLNLGLRYEVQVPWLERFDRLTRGFDLTTKNPYSDAVLANWATLKATWDAANPTYPYPAPPSMLRGGYLFPGVGGQPRRLYDTDWTNLAPRIGVAWRVAEKTVIRSGAGVYYQSPTQTGVVQGFSQQTAYTSTLDGITPSAGLTGPYSLVNPFPLGIAPPPHASLGLLTNVGNSVSFDPPHYKIPRTYQYSFGIQQELPHGILVEASYTGNYQTYIESSFNYGYISLADYNLGRATPLYLDRSLPNPFYGILPVTSSLGASATTSALNLRRLNPIFPGMTNNLVQDGHYRYDALQAKIEKRVLAGAETGVMTWVLSYTFSKAYEANHRLNNWNPEEPVIYELDYQTKPHSLSFSGVWDLPFGKNRKFTVSNPVASTLASNWRFDWIFTYFSGYPVGWPNFQNVCGEWHATEQTEDHWFNNDKTCYKPWPSYTVRTIPDRFPDIREPAEPQLNIALEKTFDFTERYKLQFRWEAFNVTNTPIRPAPDTNYYSATFGQLPKYQKNWPRVMQVALKFFF